MPPRGGTSYDSSPAPWGGMRGSINYKVEYRVRRNTYCGALYRRIVLTALEMREEAQPGGVTDQDRQRAFAVCAEVRELLRLRVRRRGASAPVVLSRSFLREIAPRRKDRRDGRGAASTWKGLERGATGMEGVQQAPGKGWRWKGCSKHLVRAGEGSRRDGGGATGTW